MADMFSSLLAIQFPDSIGAKGNHGNRIPGLSPTAKDGIWNERGLQMGGTPNYLVFSSANAFVQGTLEQTSALNANVSNTPSALLTGLVSYYKFDLGAVTDLVGSNHGTDSGTLIYSNANGKINGGVGFDGVAYSNLGNNSSLNLTGALSFSAWINPTDFASNRMILVRSTTFTDAAYEWRLETTTGRLRLIASSSNFDSTVSPTAGAWNHVVVTRSAGNAVIHYLNGAAVGSGSVSAATSQPTTNTLLGNRFDNFGEFVGGMDEIGIWNRVLTAGEVTTLYNAGAGLQHPF